MTGVDSSPETAGPRRSTEAVSLHPYAHIVVALDGSARAEQVLAYVESLATAFQSTVTCVCAVDPLSSTFIGETSLPAGYSNVPLGTLNEAQNEIKGDDYAYLARIKERLAKRGIEVDCQAVEGTAAEAIVVSAQEHHADLIAMTTHGRSGLGRALLGSVADAVVRTAPCPVLLVR